MSGTASQLTPDHAPITRTVAIIKNHALENRFEIDKRIAEAGFEIVKERSMEFDTDSDEDYLRDLFGEDAHSLFEGPVWVYVLARQRAIETWQTLMGDADPSVASPDSLRAIFGKSFQQNAVMGSPTSEAAEEQIAALFVSSPPFPAMAIDDSAEYDQIGDALASKISELQLDIMGRGGQNRPKVQSRERSSSNSTGKTSNGKPGFKARAVPSTTSVPSIQPRTTRAAALRAGLIEPANEGWSPSRPRVTPTKEELKQVFMDVPGHKRSSTIQVASTAPPVVAPRMTKAASLRLGQTPTSTPTKTKPRASTGSSTFEGVPGHKRRESIAVASVKAPTVAPRLNKSASLRANKDSAPPSSFMFRSPSTPKVPGGSRPPSQASFTSSVSRPSLSRRPSTSNGVLTTPSKSAPSGPGTISRTTSQSSLGSKSPPKPTSTAKPPSIAPRLNRSAMLRASMGDESTPNGSTPTKRVASTAKVNGRAQINARALVA